jgi:tetratricopeptide (TPR) repeat protein
VELLSIWKDATYLAPGIANPNYKYEPGERKADLATLRERRSQEPDNPIYDYCIGWLHQQAGDEDQARRAFERAVSTDAAHWSTLLQLTAHLDKLGRHDFADLAFAKARHLIEQGEETQVRRWSALVSFSVLMGWSHKTLDQAVRAEEFERVDRMHERIAWTFPHLEKTATAWKIAADWYAANDRDDLADKWRRHASRAGESPWLRVEQAYRSADLALALIISLLLAVWLAVFVIGVRRARSEVDRGWIPRPTWPEIAGVLLAVLLPLPLLFVHQVAVEKAEPLGDAPVEIFIDGWTSPNAHMWIEQLEPSDARAELLDRIRTIAESTRRSEAPHVDVPDHTLIIEAIEADARSTAWQKFSDNLDIRALSVLDAPSSLRVSLPAWIIGIGLWLMLGGLLGHRFPKLQTTVRYAVPGGARSAAFITPFMIAVTIAAIGSIAFGLDTILTQHGEAQFGAYFGMESLYTKEALAPSHLSAWVALGVVAALHAATLWWDRREQE